MSEKAGPKPSSKYQKPLLIFLLLIIALGILGLIGMVIFRLGQSSQLTISPTLSPALTISPSPVEEISPSSTPILTPTSRPTSTPTPTSILTSAPTATSIPTPTPTISPQADLYISEYSFNHPPKQGEAFTVRIGIYNQGNAKADAFWWEWWPTKYAYACRQRISEGIAAHGGRIVNCTYTYGGWANYETKAVADADNEVAESNETNNTHIENLIPIH